MYSWSLEDQCDIRICALTACFSLEKVDLANTANRGFLSLISKAVAKSSWVHEVTMSIRPFDANEALLVGFVSGVLRSNEEAMLQVLDLAERIGGRSLVAIQTTKQTLLRSRRLEDSEGKHC